MSINNAIAPLSWMTLPSGKLIQIRRIVGEHKPVAAVRYANEDGELAPGEFDMRLDFLAKHGKRVLPL